MGMRIDPNAIQKGLGSDVVRIEPSPHDDDVVCRIGEHWFYFGGQETEGMPVAECRATFDDATIAFMVYEAMRGLDDTEAAYYAAVLQEADLMP